MPRTIVYLITELDPGGAERALFHLATRLDRSRFTPHVICLRGFGEVGEWLKKAGVPAETLGMRGKWDLGAAFRLKSRLAEIRPDFLHSFLFHANLLGRSVARRAGVPVVIGSVRVCETRRHHLWWDRMTQGQMDAETCVCEAVRQWTEREAGVDPAKLVTIPNGVELPELEGVARTKPEALFVGRLEPQKDVATLLAAWPRVRARLPDATLNLVGKGPLEADLRRAASPGVSFLGWHADVRPFWRTARAFVLPSRWEGLPNALLEAMAWSLPAVATAVGGNLELVREGQTGHLVSPGDPERLADRLFQLLSNPAQSAQMGAAARQVVASEYTWDRMVQLHQTLYDRLGAHPK